ncbi:aspartate carbamoyltransferase [Leptospira interrogans]|uniref:Aspartate carbamoyltransferase catalytic subunit n=9 Tax=Leptospira interrogans TaxID=173 RepID=PYRB_LEPIN|nr:MULTISPECIES: aspartate carbamoyltransferase [Leptospira]Q8F812.2 RecName: Full=Aspartate carbamoyltransferase catalytic subunit; AltName: Full=Aspartate transcarbamylase; Short=ATCase [Leptospira interrogans serovar Lai str. 56601]AKH78257.1 aspartate carbamoyltransferase [Leptospira interrogans serovar Bratislava]ALN99505.1 aspartate carbamoyltransferase [Leptospira interrogans serovar Hardjo-prajitno]ASV05388.1 aspartate carbamoyltransferase [Leptospira interrogans serovar Canicola]EJP02
MYYNHKNVLDTEQFSKPDLDFLIGKIRVMERLVEQNKAFGILTGKLLASLFFEASTRTRLSFEAAMERLGGRVISTVGFQFSSISKGETLYDTMKMVEAYADIAVIRHPVEGSSRIAAGAVKIPVINAGDGAGQHPTQAILDLYTIISEKGTLDGLTVAFIGDLKYGRTIHSLINLLRHYKVRLFLISPPELALPESYKKALQGYSLTLEETTDIKAVWDCDVAYVTRIQEERFPDHKEYERLKDLFKINKELILASKKETTVLHPLPRVNELSTDVDDLPNAAYFRQARYGVVSRMTLLCLSLGQDF